VLECLRVCQTIEVDISAAEAVAVVDRIVAENNDMLCAAYPTIERWCEDIDLRAEAAAAQLAALIKKERTENA
jgi:hypothetical protein